MTSPSLTVIIHTRNEEKNIIDCIASARLLTDDILIVDMESTDTTVSLAKKNNVTVMSFPFSHYVEPAREFGIKHATGEWMLIVDADERITPELAEEIRQTIGHHEEYGAYQIPRKNIFGTQWLKHGGWWPDHQTRLIRKSAFRQWPARIHASPAIDLKKGTLNQPLIHFFHGDLAGMVEKTIVYEQIEADLLFQAKRSTGVSIFIRKYLGELYRRLIKNRGYLDGTEGIIESIYQAYSKTITYLYVYEKQKGGAV